MSSSVEGFLDWDGYRTWYRAVGGAETVPGKLPVVICHGGPGGGSDACEPMAELSEDGRLCVLYDQLGLAVDGEDDRVAGFFQLSEELRGVALKIGE